LKKPPTQITWTLAALEDTTYWQGQDKKTLERINALIKDTLREPFDGIGKPEPLKKTSLVLGRAESMTPTGLFIASTEIIWSSLPAGITTSEFE
jgi:YoeB-like toxin of bacterial type II toxin-antitoxin system